MKTEETITAPVIFITSEKMAQDVMKVQQAKELIASYTELCKNLEIDSEATEAKALEMLTDLNKIIKLVEQKHKIAKAPYLKGGKFVDNVKSDMLGNAMKVIASGKAAIATYRDALRVKQAEEEAKLLEEAQEAAKAEIQDEQENINDFVTQIGLVTAEHHKAVTECGLTKTIDELKAWHMKYSNAPTSVFNSKLAPDFVAMLEEIQKQMIALKDLRKSWFSQPARSTASWTAINQEYLEEVTRLNKIAMTSIESKPELTTAQVMLQAVKIESEMKPKGQFRWEWEVEEIEAVPAEWMIIDSEAVQNFIAANKAVLKNNQVINGVKFVQKEVISLR